MSTHAGQGGGPLPSVSGRVGRGLFWLGLERGASFVITFGCGIILARLLAPEDFGIVALAGAIFMPLGRLSGVGISQEIVQLDDSRPGFREMVGGYALVNTLLVLGIIVLAAAISFWPGLFLTVRGQQVFYLTVAGWSVSNLSAPSQALLQRAMRFGTLSLLGWFTTLLGSGAAVICALSGFGIWSLVVPQMSVLALSGAAAYVCAPWALSLSRLDEVRRSLGAKAFWYLNVGFVEEVYQRLDDIAVGRGLGAVPLAFYRRAYNLGGMFHHGAGTIFTRVLFPVFARNAQTGSGNRQAYRTAISGVSVVLTPAVCLAALQADNIIGGVYGEKWLPCVPLFRIMSVYAILLPLFEITKELLIASGRVRESARAYWTMLIVLAFLVLPGIRWLGVNGAAIAVDVALVAGLAHASIMAHRLTGTSAFACAWRTWAVCAFLVLLLWGVARVFPPVPAWFELVLAACFWGSVSCVLLWLFERRLIRHILGVLQSHWRAA